MNSQFGFKGFKSVNLVPLIGKPGQSILPVNCLYIFVVNGIKCCYLGLLFFSSLSFKIFPLSFLSFTFTPPTVFTTSLLSSSFLTVDQLFSLLTTYLQPLAISLHHLLLLFCFILFSYLPYLFIYFCLLVLSFLLLFHCTTLKIITSIPQFLVTNISK